MDVRRGQLRGEVLEALRGRVTQLAAHLHEPVHLRIADLARSLGVSQTPVREALTTLERDGLIEIIPYRGIVVHPLSLTNLRDWLEVREVLEGAAAAAAAQRASADEINDLLSLSVGLKADELRTDHPAFIQMNVEFHALILESSRNQSLQRALDPAGQRAASTRLRMIRQPDSATLSVREHVSIATGIADRDPLAAENAARQHIRRLRESLDARN